MPGISMGSLVSVLPTVAMLSCGVGLIALKALHLWGLADINSDRQMKWIVGGVAGICTLAFIGLWSWGFRQRIRK